MIQFELETTHDTTVNKVDPLTNFDFVAKEDKACIMGAYAILIHILSFYSDLNWEVKTQFLISLFRAISCGNSMSFSTPCFMATAFIGQAANYNRRVVSNTYVLLNHGKSSLG